MLGRGSLHIDIKHTAEVARCGQVALLLFRAHCGDLPLVAASDGETELHTGLTAGMPKFGTQDYAKRLWNNTVGL